MAKKAKRVHPYEVSVKGGVVTPAKFMKDEWGNNRACFEHGLLDLAISGTVCVEAHSKKEAKELALDVLYGPKPKVTKVPDGNIVDYGACADMGPVLSLQDGEAVDFEVTNIRRIPEE